MTNNKLLVIDPAISLAGLKFFSAFVNSWACIPSAPSIAHRLGLAILLKLNKTKSTGSCTPIFFQNATLAGYFFGIALRKNGLIKFLNLISVKLDGGYLDDPSIILPKDLSNFKKKLSDFYNFTYHASIIDVYNKGIEEFKIDENELHILLELTQIYYPLHVNDCYNHSLSGVYPITKSLPATVV